MNDNKTKIKLIFVPYLIISLATFIGWTFLHWLFFIKLNVQVSESAITIIVPAVLPLISVLIWLNKRLKLLNIKNGNVAFYLIIPCIAMGGLIYFARQYIILTTSKLTNLSSINQIDKEEPAKFYTLKNFYLDKKQFGTSGKSAQNLEMYIYITVPILNSVKDTLGSTCIGWYGITYNETAHDFLNDYDINELREIDLNQNVYDYDENADKINQLVKRSMMKFDNLDINQFLYLDRMSKTESDYDDYLLAIKNNTKYDTKSDVVLLPYNEPLAVRANDDLIAALAVFGIGSLLFLIIVISTDLKSEGEGILVNRQ